PRQLRYRGVLRSGYGGNRDTSEISEEVAMRMRNFLNQPVCTQHPQLPAHGCAAPFALRSIGRFGIVDQALQVSVAESVQVELPAANRQQQLVVLSQQAQTPHRSAVPGGTPLQIFGQLLQPPAVVRASQPIRVPFYHLLRYLSPPVQISY